MFSPIILSHRLNNMTQAYGNKTAQIVITDVSSIKGGDISNALNIKMSNHIGTHIDFPKHFCDEGKSLSDYDDLFWMFYKIGFVHAPFEQLEIHLDNLDPDIDMLIVKTGFEKYRGSETYTFEQPIIDPELASILRNRFSKLRVLGFDMISVSSFSDRETGRKAHRAFLCEHDILLLEDMKLSALENAPKRLFIAPLLIEQADGAPCFVYAMC